ncbi:OmpA family protein [Burkholderia sp. Bp9131]|uniref:OmpA family protein n=1 Tax=Burkholderia sp. Bp9131 TaxID=2184571 RepID=UPI000F578030|nr:OmpA family protein [Burkholderia sp. Bp9131]RQR43480.1 OmpA family protein [Burkholderia sp. Bp9131]
MSAKSLLILGATVLLAACASQGPTWNAYRVTMPNGQQAYRVDCHGLFEGQEACYSQAVEICGKKQVQPLEAVAPLGDEQNPRDVRILTFQCATPAQPAPPVAAKPVPAPVVVPAAPPKRITLDSDANFDIDKSTLKADARDKLDVLIEAAHGTTFKTVTISGYTDSTGSAEHNQQLSERRAQAVAQYLREHGLNAQKFDVRGYGESNPVASNATAPGRAKNRRVDITLE